MRYMYAGKFSKYFWFLQNQAILSTIVLKIFLVHLGILFTVHVRSISIYFMRKYKSHLIKRPNACMQLTLSSWGFSILFHACIVYTYMAPGSIYIYKYILYKKNDVCHLFSMWFNVRAHILQFCGYTVTTATVIHLMTIFLFDVYMQPLRIL